MSNAVLVIPRVWRAELARMVMFFGSLVGAVFLSKLFPGSVISGVLFSLGDSTIVLTLPLWWLLPLGVLGSLVWRIYNVRYLIDSKGIECREGILSINLRSTRIAYEDVRSIETEQTLIGRFLDFGDILIGTAATGGIEIWFEGIGSPKEVQEIIQSERERRQQRNQRTAETSASAANS